MNNYQILTTNGTVIPVTSAVYDPGTLTVTLYPSQLLSIHKLYRLTVNNTPSRGLMGATGGPLAGKTGGLPGSNYVTFLSGKLLAGPAPGMHIAARK